MPRAVSTSGHALVHEQHAGAPPRRRDGRSDAASAGTNHDDAVLLRAMRGRTCMPRARQGTRVSRGCGSFGGECPRIGV